MPNTIHITAYQLDRKCIHLHSHLCIWHPKQLALNFSLHCACKTCKTYLRWYSVSPVNCSFIELPCQNGTQDSFSTLFSFDSQDIRNKQADGIRLLALLYKEQDTSLKKLETLSVRIRFARSHNKFVADKFG